MWISIKAFLKLEAGNEISIADVDNSENKVIRIDIFLNFLNEHKNHAYVL